MQGVDLDEQTGGGTDGVPDFQDVVRRAQAKARGVSEDAMFFEDIGFHVEEE